MLLTEIITNLDRINTPAISLTLQDGLILSYDDNTENNEVFEQLNLLSDAHQTLKKDHTFSIPHLKICSVLIKLGANKNGLEDSINLFYLHNNLDKAQCIAYESRNLLTALNLSEELLSIKQLGLGPRPNQLLAKLSIQLPKIENTEIHSSTSRVTFILDRSGSMEDDHRMTMLKPAVINAIESIKQANPNTLISIYFYDDRLDTIVENQPASSITIANYERISAIKPRNGTKISVAIKPIVDNIRDQGLLNQAEEFKNLTMVWLTDGEDQSINTAEQLANLFMAQGCLTMPQLIAVGVGQYNQQLLNGVAEDVRFKANLMFHIANTEQTNGLFQVISQNIGMTRKQVMLAVDVDEKTIYKDLGVMQAGQCKSLVIEMPKPQDAITYRIILDNEIYQRTVAVSSDTYATDNNLLVDYFTQLKTNIILAMPNNPQAAEEMKALAYKSIPPLIRDARLIQLREFFGPSKENINSFDEEHFYSSGSRNSFFNNAHEPSYSQAMYSDAMQLSYSDNFSPY